MEPLPVSLSTRRFVFFRQPRSTQCPSKFFQWFLLPERPTALPCLSEVDEACAFSFKHQGREHSECLRDEDGNQWCPRQEQGKGRRWRRCSSQCPTSRLLVTDRDWSLVESDSNMRENVSGLNTSICLTEDNEACQFPFQYKGVQYSECLPPSWYSALLGNLPQCPTEVDSQLNALEDKWQHCKTNCPVVSRGKHISTSTEISLT